jgi:hypothetical protein
MRPILSHALVELNRGDFVQDNTCHSTVSLERHRADSSLEEIDLDDDAP